MDLDERQERAVTLSESTAFRWMVGASIVAIIVGGVLDRLEISYAGGAIGLVGMVAYGIGISRKQLDDELALASENVSDSGRWRRRIFMFVGMSLIFGATGIRRDRSSAVDVIMPLAGALLLTFANEWLSSASARRAARRLQSHGDQ